MADRLVALSSLMWEAREDNKLYKLIAGGKNMAGQDQRYSQAHPLPVILARKKYPRKKPGYITRKPDKFMRFAEYSAMPLELRQPATLAEWAAENGVTKATLTLWRKREELWNLVRAIQREWAKDRTGSVIHGLYRNASRYGKAPEVKLWLQAFEDFEEKPAQAPQITVIGIQGLTPEDASQLVGGSLLPNASEKQATPEPDSSVIEADLLDNVAQS